ncbi:MAG TPA: hypothetical protein VN971_00305, partial [Thermoanaerobaculia bacterium]|nr:hypothetical protein [Thermoanaerobaculia bacterium]
VRATAALRLRSLGRELTTRHLPDPVGEAHLRQAERDVSEFFDEPATRKSRGRRVTPPPGRPIGEKWE